MERRGLMAGGRRGEGNKAKFKEYSRRDFLVGGGVVIAADALAACAPATAAEPTAAAKEEYASSKGYLVYDSRKCAGCVMCMMTCSLVHEGQQNLSLARIQIVQNSFGRFPEDIRVAPCRQCVTPVCVERCPTGACHVDSANGNVRRIDGSKCIGCKACLAACPQQPRRTVWNPVTNKSTKCDLCVETPYWNEKGGPGGKQACVEVCPMKAIRFVTVVPDQTQTDGYDVNLRNEHWVNLGLVDNMEMVPPSWVPKRAAKGAKG
jgi:protein NrfC